MASSGDPKRTKQTPTDSTPVGQPSTNSTTEASNSSADDPPILRLPPELLSAIINNLPMSQWSSMEFVNRSFRNAAYLSWRSVKEFDVGKDVLTVRQSFNGAKLSDFLQSILDKLHLRSPLLSSIIGLPSMGRREDIQSRSEVLHIISQFSHLKRIDFGDIIFESVELVEFMTSSANRDQLKEISASTNYQRTNRYWQDIFVDQENRDRQASQLQLEKLSLKTGYHSAYLDPGIIDLIDPSSLAQLVLVNIAAPCDYLLLLISNCQQLQQLQFSFMSRCHCHKGNGCVQLISSKWLLETISALENLSSLKIGMIEIGGGYEHYLDIWDDLPILIDRLGQRGRLVEFGLLHEDYCSDEVITGIGNHLPYLKSLELIAHVPPFTSRSAILVNMIKKLVNLEVLTFKCDITCQNGITSEVLNAVATYLQHLKSFHLWLGYYDHDVAKCLHVLTRLERLEELSIFGGLFTQVNWDVDASFGPLRSLDMRECHKDLMVSILNRTPELHRLVLFGSRFTCIPGEVLRMIPEGCQQLRQLDVVDTLDKEAVREIVDRMPALMQLKCRKWT